LDGIDLSVVVNKNFDGPNSDSLPGAKKKNRSVTGSELRWVYRHRELKDIQKYIQFWFKFEPCCPPWVGLPSLSDDGSAVWSSEKDALALWAKYKPRATQVDHEAAEGKREKET
jgi:hypothetical protein